MNYSIVMGLLCSLVGIGVGLHIAYTATASDYKFFFVYSGLAAFLTSSILWYYLVAKPEVFTTKRGIMIGVISGAFSHYVCWYINFIVMNLCNKATRGCVDSLGAPPADLWNALWGAGVLSLYSLLFYGWVTLPLGGLIGGILVQFQKK